jgi:hypothetical protein
MVDPRFICGCGLPRLLPRTRRRPAQEVVKEGRTRAKQCGVRQGRTRAAMNSDWFMAGDAARRAYNVRVVGSINFVASFYNLGGSELQGGEPDSEEESERSSGFGRLIPTVCDEEVHRVLYGRRVLFKKAHTLGYCRYCFECASRDCCLCESDSKRRLAVLLASAVSAPVGVVVRARVVRSCSCAHCTPHVLIPFRSIDVTMTPPPPPTRGIL